MTEQQPPIDTESRWACRCSQDSPDGIRLLWDAPQRRGFQNLDGRYIVTFDGSIDGNLIQIAVLVTESAASKVESIRNVRAPVADRQAFPPVHGARPASEPGPRRHLGSASNSCVTLVSVRVRACSISACGRPRQNKPDSSTLVSTTARMSPALGTNGFYRPIDLFHRHRLDAGFGHALADRQQRIGRLPAPDRIPKQRFERLGCQEPRLARSARRRVGQLNLAPSGVSGRACAYAARCALIRSASCGVKCRGAIFRSYRLCRFIQNSAEVPK